MGLGLCEGRPCQRSIHSHPSPDGESDPRRCSGIHGCVSLPARKAGLVATGPVGIDTDNVGSHDVGRGMESQLLGGLEAGQRAVSDRLRDSTSPYALCSVGLVGAGGPGSCQIQRPAGFSPWPVSSVQVCKCNETFPVLMLRLPRPVASNH
jgi:hypothetical protein